MKSLFEKVVITPRSPFARRIRLALRRFEIPCAEVEATPFEPTEEFLKQNPLGTVPILILKNGIQWLDSASILEGLNDLGYPVWPKDSNDRIAIRQASTLAEGLMTAAVSFFLENQRGEKADPSWIEDHEAVVRRTLKRIAETTLDSSPWIHAHHPTQAGWDLAVALEYLDLRMPKIHWAKDYPNLVAHLKRCQEFAPFFNETRPPAAV